jgi:hypothetical protein
MVLGGPRSGTTWAANWLTTDTTICLHDPLLEYTIERLQRLTFPGGQSLGISCTSAMLYPDWVNAQRCPKVVLHRPIAEINRSLRELGLVELIPERHEARLDAIKGPGVLHCPYEHMYTPTGGRVLAHHLRVPFDQSRHHCLTQMRVEPMWKHLSVGKEAAMQLVKRITEAR